MSILILTIESWSKKPSALSEVAPVMERRRGFRVGEGPVHSP